MMGITEIQGTLIKAADIPRLDRGGVVMSPLATREQGASDTIVLLGKVAPGLEFPAHSHDHQEILVFLTGSARGQVGDTEYEIAAGDVLLIPAHSIHSFEATGGGTLEAIGITAAGTRTFRPDGEELLLNG
jgi:quercetin dioxygenase-like cupin family protein